MAQIETAAYEQLMDQTSRTMDAVAQYLAKVLANLSDRIVLTGENDDGIKALLKHMDRGGKVDTTPIAIEDEQIVEELMRGTKCPFVILRDAEKGNLVLLTRDCDREQVKDVMRLYGLQKGAELQELEVGDFMKLYEGKEIRMCKELSPEEADLFRERAKQYDCTYTVIKSDEPGMFDILYPKEKAKGAENALKDVAYDYAGEKGAKFRQAVEENIEKREAFKENIRPKEGKTVYICPKDDPTRFIAVTRDGFSVHNLQATREKQPDGSELIHATDKNPKSYAIFDRKELGRLIDTMKDPVVLTQDEMSIVRGLTVTGTARFVKDEEFRGKYKELKKTLAEKEVSYPAALVKSPSYMKENLVYFRGLTSSQVDTIQDALIGSGVENQLIPGTDRDSRSIAFPKRLSDKILPEVEKVLYGDSTGAERLEKELSYAGRGSLQIGEAGDVVIDAKMKGVAIFFNEEGMQIRRNPTREERERGLRGVQLQDVRRDDPAFAEQAAKVISLMREPVVLEKEEYALRNIDEAEFGRIVQSRIPSENKPDAVKEYEGYVEAHQQAVYDKLHAMVNNVDGMSDLSERQQEAVQAHFTREYEDVYVKRSLLEKVMTLDMSDSRYAGTVAYEMMQQTESIER